MKKALSSWNTAEICVRFKALRILLGFKSKTDFAAVIGVKYTTYVNYEKIKVPPTEVLTEVKKKFPRANIDYLLTGEEGSAIHKISHDATDPSHKLLDIILESQNPVLKRAIMANLEAFSGTVKTEERLELLERQVAELTAMVQQQSRMATDRRRTPGTNPEGDERRSGKDRRIHYDASDGNHV